MNTFKRKSLYAALASLGALGATGAAQAVNLNPDGLGQVLVYPYFTVRADANNNAYNSLLSVVNTTNSVKAVKVRFLEGKNSREVLDFNLFLSPFDVWTTAIIPSPSGGGKIITTDKSCTLPAIPAGGVDFVNFAYVGDTGGDGLDRTKEGYVEIIEMATYLPTSKTATRVTHVSGVPPGCAANNDTDAAAEAQNLGGGLMGGLTLINVNAGTDFTTEPTVLDNFFTIGNLYTAAGVTTPDLTFAAPPVSLVVASNASGVWQSTWAPGPDAVSAVLMHDNVLNEYVLDTATKSGTDWVITMPTKRFYVNVGTGSAPKLFQRNFNTKSCDDVSLNIYDREEQTTSTPISFSPPPPAGVNQLCWEANVVTFGATSGSNVLASLNNTTILTSFQNGWLKLGFFPSTVTGAVHTLPNAATTFTPVPGTTGAAAAATYYGLPVIGFAVQSFTNGTLVIGGTTVLSNYGGNFVHKYTRKIQ